MYLTSTLRWSYCEACSAGQAADCVQRGSVHGTVLVLLWDLHGEKQINCGITQGLKVGPYRVRVGPVVGRRGGSPARRLARRRRVVVAGGHAGRGRQGHLGQHLGWQAEVGLRRAQQVLRAQRQTAQRRTRRP